MNFDLGTATGMTNSAIAESIRQQGMNTSIIWLGIDSLTAGASGVSYNVPLEKFARGAVGWGGRWVPFEPNQTFGETTDGFKTGQSDMRSTLPRSDVRRAMSFDGKGTYSDAIGTRFTYETIPNFNWSSATIYYLQQPSGGTVTVDYPQDSGGAVIDTDGALSIQSVTIQQRKKATLSSSQVLRLNNLALDGAVVFYGIVFHSGDSGPVWLNAGTGGQKTSEFVEYTHQSEWFDLLGVTHAIVNAGTNDRATSTAGEFEADLRTICSSFDEKVVQYVVKPNETDGGASPFDSVYPQVATSYGQLIDLPSLFGSYTDVNSAGQMLDGTHPNEHYQYYQAQHYSWLLFGRGFYVETPPIIDYTATDTQALIDGSFKSLIP